MPVSATAFYGAIAILVALDVLAIGATFVNARFSSRAAARSANAEQEAEAARDAAREAQRRSARNTRRIDSDDYRDPATTD